MSLPRDSNGFQFDAFSHAYHPKTMNIPIPQDLQDYIAGLVETGHYSGSDEVLEEALREHQARHGRGGIIMTTQLEQLLDEGLDNLDKAKDTDELRRS
jgi:putative addiction module CopG family antidote